MPSHKSGRDKPAEAEFGQLNSYLRRNKPARMTQGQWNQVVTDKIQELRGIATTRAALVAGLAVWFREFPKG